MRLTVEDADENEEEVAEELNADELDAELAAVIEARREKYAEAEVSEDAVGGSSSQ